MNRKITILGCGYLGYSIANFLSKKSDVSVIGFSNEYSKELPDNITFIEGDVFDEDFIDKLDLKDNIVINSLKVGNFKNLINNIGEELQALEKLTKLILKLSDKNISIFLEFSSGGTVYGDKGPYSLKETAAKEPISLYGISKSFIEDFLRVNYYENGLKYNILRIGNPFGGFQSKKKEQGVIPILIRKTINNEPFELWDDINSTRDYIYIEDFLRALELVIKNGEFQETYNIGNGKGASIGEIIQLVEKKLGENINYITKINSKKGIFNNSLDISKLKKLGYEKRYSLEEGIRLEIERINNETYGGV